MRMTLINILRLKPLPMDTWVTRMWLKEPLEEFTRVQSTYTRCDILLDTNMKKQKKTERGQRGPEISSTFQLRNPTKTLIFLLPLGKLSSHPLTQMKAEESLMIMGRLI